MRETIDLLLGLNDFHWRGSAYQWFLYAGILLVLVLEKRRMPRIVFGWLPLTYLVLMLNPATIKLLDLAGLSNHAYFVRLFSFMPLMYVIARGFTFLLNIGNHWVKLACVCLVCAVICLTGKNIYSESWLTRAENYAKVPQETMDILDAVGAQTGEKVSVAGIDASPIYMRQVADVIMPYGRSFGYLGELLSEDPPDVQRTMEVAGQQDVDYILAHRSEDTLSAFADQGYEPHALTENYAIFRVEGVPTLKRTLNDKRQIVSTTNYDTSGEPLPSMVGYTSVAYEYDADGREVKEIYLDREDELYSTPEGCNSINLSYYLNGFVKTVSCLDRDGNPVTVDGRYKTRYSYNGSGQMRKVSYFDTDDRVIAEVGEGLPVESDCLRFCRRSEGAQRDGDKIRFATKKDDNRFSYVLFQLWDGKTGEYLLSFGEGYEPSGIEGQYVHQLPSGLYRLCFKGNTNLADEYIYSLEYLTEGETLYYRYDLDDLEDKKVEVSNLYIGREKPPVTQ